MPGDRPIIPFFNGRMINGQKVEDPVEIIELTGNVAEVPQGGIEILNASECDLLITLSLSPCIALILYDSQAKRGAIAHVVHDTPETESKIVDFIRLNFDDTSRLQASIIGGRNGSDSTFESLQIVCNILNIKIKEIHLGMCPEIKPPRPRNIVLRLEDGKILQPPPFGAKSKFEFETLTQFGSMGLVRTAARYTIDAQREEKNDPGVEKVANTVAVANHHASASFFAAITKASSPHFFMHQALLATLSPKTLDKPKQEAAAAPRMPAISDSSAASSRARESASTFSVVNVLQPRPPG